MYCGERQIALAPLWGRARQGCRNFKGRTGFCPETAPSLETGFAAGTGGAHGF